MGRLFAAAPPSIRSVGWRIIMHSFSETRAITNEH